MPQLLLVLALACNRGDDVEPQWDPAYDTLAAAVEAERVASGSPAAVFAVFDAEGIRFAAGFGSRRPGEVAPVGADTRFRIGSITKGMTAAALLVLEEEGKLNLDDPLHEVVPGFTLTRDAARAEQITVRQLLTHESGMWEYTEIDGPASDDALALGAEQFNAQGWLLAPPGAFWNYSNSGYVYAGLAAEVADGRPYREVMAERVFAPMGFERAAFTEAEVVADEDYAVGLGPNWETGRGEREYGPESYDSAFSRPAGFAWMSITDLARWGQTALRRPEALYGQAAWEDQLAPHVDLEMANPADHYGLGWIVSDGFHDGAGYRATPLISHGGQIPGFSADIWVLPELNIGFAAVNARSNAHLTEVLNTAFDLTNLPAPSASPLLGWEPADAAAIAGTWIDPFNAGTLILNVEGDTLAIDAPLLDEYNVPYARTFVPFGKDNLVWDIQGTTLLVSFIRDDQGTPTWLRTRAFAAERQPENARATASGDIGAFLARVHAGDLR